uniref:DUF632 domain-containing protein n=3 Tax=Aegilops tauschii subsp. strangulata TaxID=200361 RepID=A0A453NJB0_AEGTS
MGCSSSKNLDEEEAVKTCHDRRSFVKKAIAQRDLLASSHVAYLQSLRRVSLALFYCLAEDEHLYFLQDTAAQCTHRPCSPEKRAVLLVVNRLRQGGAPVHPLVGRWDGEAGAPEAAVVDGFFGVDPRLFRPPANDVPVSSPSHLPSAWDVFWVDPFSSLPTDRVGYVNHNHGVEEVRNADQEDGEMLELEEISEDGSNGEDESEKEEAHGHEQAERAQVVVAPREEEEKRVVGVSKKLRVRASAEVEQQSTPGRFTVFVDRPPASVAEAMRDIKGHFSKIAETAAEVSVLLEVVPYQKKVRPPAQRGDVEGGDGDEQVGTREASPEPFQLFQSHKESLDRLYAWEKKLYEEVRAGERVRLSYEKKVAQLRSQDANGAEPFAIERTRAAIRDLRTKLNISLASVDAVSRRIVAVRDDELLPQLAELIRGLARMWRVIGDAHRVMKRTADEASALLSSSAAGAEGGIRGPPPPPGPTRAATAAGALATELRGWRAALEAWAESQRGYAAALWGWARSCVKDGEDMPRLIVAWARAVEAVDVDAATRAVEGVAAEAAAIAAAARRRSSSAEEEPPNEEEGKRRVCVGLAAALGAIAEAGGLASAAYRELVAEMNDREREAEMAGRDDEPSIQ